MTVSYDFSIHADRQFRPNGLEPTHWKFVARTHTYAYPNEPWDLFTPGYDGGMWCPHILLSPTNRQYCHAYLNNFNVMGYDTGTKAAQIMRLVGQDFLDNWWNMLRVLDGK